MEWAVFALVQSAGGIVVVYSNKQKTAKGGGPSEVIHVSAMQDVKTTICKYQRP